MPDDARAVLGWGHPEAAGRTEASDLG
jgi:hypothetical protein